MKTEELTKTAKADLERISNHEDIFNKEYNHYFEDMSMDGYDKETAEELLGDGFEIMRTLTHNDKLPSIPYIYHFETSLENLKIALNKYLSNEKADQHNAKKAFEITTKKLREYKKFCQSQIESANKAIAFADEYLEICEKYRK